MTINLSALQKQRRDTAANWTAEDPTLLAGEIGLESDTGYWKVGDGATAWTSLAYVSGLGAEIPVDRLADGAARQLLQTDAAGTGVEWTDNVDVPGTLDVTGTGTFDGNVTIAGDLTVNGTTTTINTQDLLVEDKNIIIGNVTTPSDVTADGGGITLKGATDKTINWVDATDAWTLSEHVNIASGKEYRINGTNVLDATSLGSGVTSSSLTSVGTIGTGTWQGTTVATGYGGTGQTTYTDGQLLIGKTDGTLAKATITQGSGVTITNGDGTITIAATGSGGTVTSVDVTGGTGLTSSGGPITSSGTITVDLDNTAVTPGSYTYASITVDQQGRLTAASNGTTPLTSSDIGVTVQGYDADTAKLDVAQTFTAAQTFAADLTLNAQSDLRFADSDSSNWVAFQGPATISSNVTWTLPDADGTSGQVLSTDGAGALSWSTAATDKIEEGNTSAEVIDTGSDGRFVVTTEGTERLRVTDTGLVGIGTSAPGAGLHIVSPGQTTSALNTAGDLNTIISDTGVSAGNGGSLVFAAASGQWRFASIKGFVTNGSNNSQGDITFSTRTVGTDATLTEKVRIDSQGRVGIGDTGPDSTLTVKAASGVTPFKVSGPSSEFAKIDSSGRLLVGTSSSRQGNGGLQVESTGGNSFAYFTRNVNSSGGVEISLQKSRGTANGSFTVVAAEDEIGRINFNGADGTTDICAARIIAAVDGTPGANDMPGRLVFSTTADGASSPTERMRIDSNGFFKASNSGAYRTGTSHELYSTTNANTFILTNTNASYSNNLQLSDIWPAASSSYSFLLARSNVGSSADNEFNLRGDGNAYADGTWTGGGADYAEYFEWSDANPTAEDRRGISVVLDGDKIREAQAGEDPIGVISGNPSVVGDAAWNKWSGKYLRDEYGTYILDENGERQLNPAYDPDVEYVSREERPEWDCVGLMGKLRIRKGQVIGSRWIKMRDINDSVEEWLVR